MVPRDSPFMEREKEQEEILMRTKRDGRKYRVKARSRDLEQEEALFMAAGW